MWHSQYSQTDPSYFYAMTALLSTQTCDHWKLHFVVLEDNEKLINEQRCDFVPTLSSDEDQFWYHGKNYFLMDFSQRPNGIWIRIQIQHQSIESSEWAFIDLKNSCLISFALTRKMQETKEWAVGIYDIREYRKNKSEVQTYYDSNRCKKDPLGYDWSYDTF